MVYTVVYLIITRVCSIRYLPRHTAGITGTGRFGNFSAIWIPVPQVPPVPVQTSLPVPDTSASSVQHQYRYRTLQKVRYINTGTGHCKFGTSIPVPPVPVWTSAPKLVPVSVQHRYRYRTLPGRFGKSGTTSTRYCHVVTSK